MIHKEDPPATSLIKRDLDWDLYVKEMKETPNQFFNVGEFSPGIAHYIRVGGNAAFLPKDHTGDAEGYMRRHWEVTSRTVGRNPHRVAVYCRWLP